MTLVSRLGMQDLEERAHRLCQMCASYWQLESVVKLHCVVCPSRGTVARDPRGSSLPGKTLGEFIAFLRV
jgi:hypothetical protein